MNENENERGPSVSGDLPEVIALGMAFQTFVGLTMAKKITEGLEGNENVIDPLELSVDGFIELVHKMVENSEKYKIDFDQTTIEHLSRVWAEFVCGESLFSAEEVMGEEV